MDYAWAEMAKFFWFSVRLTVLIVVRIVEAMKNRNHWGDEQ